MTQKEAKILIERGYILGNHGWMSYGLIRKNPEAAPDSKLVIVDERGNTFAWDQLSEDDYFIYKSPAKMSEDYPIY